jgi:CBS domain-containing protein
MRAHQIMTRNVITVTPETSVVEAATRMLQHHVSGLPVVNESGELVGIVSEGDFLRRSEIGTQRKRSSWLQYFVGPGRAGADFVHEHGRKVGEVMTRDPVTVAEETTLDELVDLMEKNRIKRLPVTRNGALVGILTRASLLRLVACMAHEIPDPTADDNHIRDRITRAIRQTNWRPIGFHVTVRNGTVHLHGIITDERSREAAIVAAENTSGVKEVHDHLCWVDAYSGFYVESAEDQKDGELI